MSKEVINNINKAIKRTGKELKEETDKKSPDHKRIKGLEEYMSSLRKDRAREAEIKILEDSDQRKEKSEEKPRAVVREVDGKLVLDDPDAVAVMEAVGKHNCQNTLELNADRVAHFKNRISERELTASNTVIVLLNVDDVHGGPIADILMPEYNWKEIRDRGEVPFARGLADREFIQEVLNTFDQEAGKKLQDMSKVAVVVVDHGVAEVFSA
ncbi:hypothetical protein KAS79_01665 [Candidatus Parcubacteria bacterium]|nr:hypothetical protein [Candidatus Parcubacteria bacterium]